MDKLDVNLEYCYGIKKLNQEFDFSDNRVYAIYASNGSMKSSFAKTFADLSKNSESKDLWFPERKTVRQVTYDQGIPLPSESIFVIEPYNIDYWHSDKTSILLVDSKLRLEHEQLYIDIEMAKERLLNSLKETSGSKKNIEEEISYAFTNKKNQFYDAIRGMETILNDMIDPDFDYVSYDKIFDDKVYVFLEDKKIKSSLKEYIDKYNELLDASTYLKRSTFDCHNAANISKDLSNNGYFGANHYLTLNGAELITIKTKEEFDKFISKEKETILSDKTLRNKFDAIEKAITKNNNVKEFGLYIANNRELLNNLDNIQDFRKEVWYSYIKKNIVYYLELINKIKEADKRKMEIEDIANNQRTQWEEVIDIFNNRFHLPFKLSTENKIDVVLGRANMPSLCFKIHDNDEEAHIDRPGLMQTLSTGEKKALYILNIIFEIQVRRKNKTETLFIIDDIADSFDYKNKYAIIQYLMDIAEEKFFKQIILTHNFDFLRTINSRYLVPYNHCLIALKGNLDISLVQNSGIQNIFINDWKKNFHNDVRKRIASIAFVRNIIEYTKGVNDLDFLKLTSLLHWKKDSASILQKDFVDIFDSAFLNSSKTTCLDGNERSMIDIIIQEANSCLNARDGINFENKIVLSIAIRILSEKFMVETLNDEKYWDGIKHNQTPKLFERFKAVFNKNIMAINIIQRVLLMTPENIHLNSFMYEPIIDMCDFHLRVLYRDVLSLDSSLNLN